MPPLFQKGRVGEWSRGGRGRRSAGRAGAGSRCGWRGLCRLLSSPRGRAATADGVPVPLRLPRAAVTLNRADARGESGAVGSRCPGLVLRFASGCPSAFNPGAPVLGCVHIPTIHHYYC